MSRRGKTLAVLVAAVVAAGVVVGIYLAGRDTVNLPSAARYYTTSAGRTFFWGSNPDAPFTTAQQATIAQSSSIVVISPQYDNFNLAAQERTGRALTARNPALRVLFYLNTKHYLYESRHPELTSGFDPATMALHDAAGNPVLYKASSSRPDGIGYYVDNTSAAWHSYFLATARQIMAAGNFGGIAMDSLRPLTSPADRAAISVLTPQQVSAWNAGQQQLLEQVKAAFPHKLVLYNGISPTVRSQTQRNLAPLQVADATLNEAYCVERNEPSPSNVISELAVMRSAAQQHKIILEKVNYAVGDNWPDAELLAFAQRYGGFCLGGFLLGYQPGSTFFDFSDGYDLSQLTSNPAETALDLGSPRGDYELSDDIGHRSFERGQVYVNLGPSTRTVRLSAGGLLVAGRHQLGRYKAGDLLTIEPLSSAFLVDPRP